MNKTVVVDCRICNESIDSLKALGYNIVKISKNRNFDEPISAHPDIFLVKVADKWFIDSAVHDIFTFVSEKVKFEREVAPGEKYMYPQDVCLNCVQVGNYLICNKKHTALDILEAAKENNIEIVDVNQGYAKCSVCVVGDNAIITEDIGIANAVSDRTDVDVLLIEKGHVKLDGYQYGFFGGAGGLVENNLLVFNGSIEKHPDYRKIKEFCDKHSVRIQSLSSGSLYDIGTIIRLD